MMRFPMVSFGSVVVFMVVLLLWFGMYKWNSAYVRCKRICPVGSWNDEILGLCLGVAGGKLRVVGVVIHIRWMFCRVFGWEFGQWND